MAVPKFTFVKYKNKDITALAKKLAGSLDKDVATLKSIRAAAKSAPLSESLLKDLKLQIAKYIEALVEQEGSDTDSDLDAFVHKARKNKKKEYTTFATGILCRVFFSLSLSIDISICQTHKFVKPTNEIKSIFKGNYKKKIFIEKNLFFIF